MPRVLPLSRLPTLSHADPDRRLVERFATTADEAAFAELVRRHGPLVLGVCRRAARDPHLADDAFQATFLTLARKAGSLRDPGALSSWLFGVARRVATAARRREDRRDRLARRAADRPAPATTPAGWHDLLAVLDEELARLPERFRAPLLACYLDGRTQDEAARQLGWSLSTLRRRLEAARTRLKVRMTARGATLGGGLFAGVLAPASAAVPEPLARAAVEQAGGGAASPRVLELAASTSLPLAKWAGVAAGLVLVCGLAVGLVSTPPAPPASPEPRPPATAAATPAVPDDPLPPGAVARMGNLRFRHPVGVESLHFARGGKLLVSSGAGRVCVWDARTGRRLRLLGPPDHDPGPWGVELVGIPADGRTLAVRRRGPPAATGFVWDLERDAELRTFEIARHHLQKTGPFPRLLAPDGSRIAEVDPEAETVRLWDSDGKPAGRLDGAVGKAEGGLTYPFPAAFAPDGKLLYVARTDHTVEVWDAATCKRVRTFGGGKPRPRALAVSADGKYLATFGGPSPRDKRGVDFVPEAVRVWDPGTGDLLAEFPWGKVDPTGYYDAFVGFRPDGAVWGAVKGRASESLPLTFRQWDRKTGRAVREWSAPLANWTVRGVTLSPDGTRLAAGVLNSVLVFDAATGKDLTPEAGHRGEVAELRFTPDGDRLVTVGGDRTVRVWDAATGTELRSHATPASQGHLTHLSADGSVLFGSRPGGVPDVTQWSVTAREVATGRERWALSRCAELAVHPDGQTAWGHMLDKKHVAQIDTATGTAVRTVPGPTRDDAKSHFAWWVHVTLGDGGRLVVCANGKEVAGWDAATGRKRFGWSPERAGLLPNGDGHHALSLAPDHIAGLAVSADGKKLAAVVYRNGRAVTNHWTACVCESASGSVLRSIALPDDYNRGFRPVAWGPDGKSVAVVGGAARLYDAATGAEKAAFGGHRGRCDAVAFSPDGTRLATGSADGTALVWALLQK
jgi:RNA polymerase sigma factor (sigma-70 family)